MFETDNSNAQACQSSNKIKYCTATFTVVTNLIDTIACLVSKKVNKNKIKKVSLCLLIPMPFDKGINTSSIRLLIKENQSRSMKKID